MRKQENTVNWHPAQVPIFTTCDILVCGGGPAGCAAALAARRAGCSVLLLESQGQLGGMGTSGLVAHWLGGRSYHDRRWVVGGIFRELSQESAAAGIALLPEDDTTSLYQPHGWFKGLLQGVPFDPFAMAAFLDRKMAADGIDVLFNTQAIDVIVADGRISHVLCANKGGVQAVAARVVIDATGDADIAARSGCDVCVGREEDGLMAPATLMMHVDNVEQQALADYIQAHDTPRFRAEIARWREAGEWPFPYEIFISVQLDQPGTMMINTSRLCDVDGLDPESITRAYQRGREESLLLLEVMRQKMPGCAQARLKAVAPLLGVRETRRIVGDFVLTVADLMNGASYHDTIGFSSYGWDLPDPKRPSHQPMEGVKKSPFTPMPYRIMLPKPINNLLCPGRAVSVERDVLGPLRVMAPVMAMGEAAGLAAAQALTRDIACGDVDTDALRAALLEAGAILDMRAI